MSNIKNMKTQIKAEIVADSINQQEDRITTYLLTFPRFILAELNTHRVFSKNSASSRAIPFHKMVEMVKTDPFIPIAWQKDHKGMQGNEYFTKVEDIERNTRKWLTARDNAINSAKWLNAGFAEDESGIGVTKQLCNRLLEPFMWTTMLITGSKEGWDNFFSLRCPRYLQQGKFYKSKKDAIKNHPRIKEGLPVTELDWLKVNTGQSEIHMMDLAEKIFDAMNESTPKELKAGEWHIPYLNEINKVADEVGALLGKEAHFLTSTLVAVSSALAARVSYTTIGSDFDIDHERLLKLHDRLVEDRHLSVFEHCARVMSNEEYNNFFRGDKRVENFLEEEEKYLSQFGWCNNLKGFIQYRYLIENNYDGFRL